MNSSSIAAELQQLQQYETYVTIVRELGVSATTLYIWDFGAHTLFDLQQLINLLPCQVLTFHHEVAILWGTKWTTSRILFFINRYLALGVVILSAWCRAFMGYGIVGVILVSKIEIILLRRLFVLYNHKRVIVIPLVALFICVFGVVMGFAIAMTVYTQTHGYTIYGICIPPTPPWFFPFWSPVMAFDFIIMVLAGFKSVQYYRRVPNKNWSGAQLMKILARDSFIYFACNFLNYLLITFVFQLAPPEFFVLGTSWTITIPPITANRLLINMEQSHFRNEDSTMEVEHQRGIRVVRGRVIEMNSLSEY
ncbi:hypothetical protein DFH29DRAFT_1002325 [Suillus ampliporus]|nr:hypothetical protein DFH29DRAFT_1002325 [Suillus ampliporus]